MRSAHNTVCANTCDGGCTTLGKGRVRLALQIFLAFRVLTLLGSQGMGLGQWTGQTESGTSHHDLFMAGDLGDSVCRSERALDLYRFKNLLFRHCLYSAHFLPLH